MVNKENKSERWAYFENGEAHFLKEAEYHGNPIDQKGSAVTFHFGHDLPNLIQNKTKMTTTVYYIDNIYLGIRAEYIEVLASKKNL